MSSCIRGRGLGAWAAFVAVCLLAHPGLADEIGEATMGVEVLNGPPEGLVALFNGKDLMRWKGLVGDPPKRSRMSPEDLAAAQAEADENMRQHWRAVDGVLCFDGKGESLCTAKDYGDFEMLVDWKIEPGGDSGIYLRGSPQVQIWDPANLLVGAQVGSGGLYNNQKGSAAPLKKVDNPVGQWNRFRIVMIEDLVTVYLNGELVVDNVVMENYWQRDKPIYPMGQIELQAHNTALYFRNVFLREIPRESGRPEPNEAEKAEGFTALFNGKDLTGWTGNTKGYIVRDGKIIVDPRLGGGNLFTQAEYGDFVLRFEFRLTPGANNGIAIRSPLSGDPAYDGLEIQILDDMSPKQANLKPYQYHGSIYGVVAAKREYLKPVGLWNSEEIGARGNRISVKLNGTTIVDADIAQASIAQTLDGREHLGLKQASGHIGFCGHGSYVEFRNLRIKPLE